MPELISIGRFSDLTGLTAKALRLYDKMGLLPPKFVDVDSGYRYYGLDQVAVARGIQTLRLLHMPLAEIAALLRADDLDVAQDHLDQHHHRIKEQIAEYQAVLNHLPTAAKWRRSIGKESEMTSGTKTYVCSFCDKDDKQVRRMIAGPRGVAICNECVTLANQMINDEEANAGASA